MSHVYVTKLAMFAIFAIFFGIAETGCVLVIRRQWKIMKSHSETRFDKAFDIMKIVIMIPPFLAFLFGFVFSMVLAMGTLFRGY